MEARWMETAQARLDELDNVCRAGKEERKVLSGP
jgi:hypothetical protein